ncbi:MAG: CvpA family protein [Cellvibrionaceae bacterium]
MMDFTWIVFLVIAGFFTYKGYRNGILATVARVASFIAGYIASLLFGGAAASFIERATSLDGITAFLLGGIGVFVLASFLVGLLFSRIAKKIQKERGEKISTASSFFGAGLGLCVGSAIAFFMVFFISFAQDMVQSKKIINSSSQALDTNENKTPKNIVEKASKNIASKMVEVVTKSSDMDPASAKIAGAFMNNPKEVMDNIQGVVNSPSTRALFNDPVNQDALNSNDPQAIAELPAFQEMINDPKMKQLAEASGFNSLEGEAFNQELAEKIGSMWGRAQAVKNDERVQEIFRDPEFQKRLKSNNPMMLIADPQFMEVVKILTTDEPVDNTPTDSNAQEIKSGNGETSSDKPKEVPVIKRWVDESGQVHFSDEKPK